MVILPANVCTHCWKWLAFLGDSNIFILTTNNQPLFSHYVMKDQKMLKTQLIVYAGTENNFGLIVIFLNTAEDMFPK